MKTDDDFQTCEATIVHKDAVEKVRKFLPGEERIYQLSEFFKVMADPTRVKILNALFYSELCVCDLQKIIGISQSAISHQLKLLRSANLVKYKKKGKSVYYSLSDIHVKTIYEQGIIHIKEKCGE